MWTEKRSWWDTKEVKTNLFAQELKDQAEDLRELEGYYQGQIAELLQVLQVEIAKIPKPGILPRQPELLPTTEPLEARELRRIERRDWKRAKQVERKQWREYWGVADPIRRGFIKANRFQLMQLAARYLWLKDVRSKPLHGISGTAFYGIVGYWLREHDRIVKRGYLFNSDAEERVVMRELYDRIDEWQPEGGRVLPEGKKAKLRKPGSVFLI